MNPKLTLATTARVLNQLRRDPRTLALIVIVPGVLMWLFSEVFADSPEVFQRVGPAMLVVFPFIVMFLITSVTMVRERISGTLERLMTTPLGKADLVLGYALAFGLLALVQAAVISALTLYALDLREPASVPVFVLIAVTDAVLGAALGLGFSALARTEFQAVQFMPAVVLPQVLLCGLLIPVDQMSGWLRAISRVMPLRYAVSSMNELTAHTTVSGRVWWDLMVVAGCALAALIVGATTLRRRVG
ncbi:ABC transporter permease [Pseudonocardiaceae bacterium YIM PH 21723]|nr:ABC transporter permease [Pseudonocardiaceae bacterium YIM PH 21723]